MVTMSSHWRGVIRISTVLAEASECEKVTAIRPGSISVAVPQSFRNSMSRSHSRSYFTRPAWALRPLIGLTAIGMHALRDHYSSLLIRFGESVKTVQIRLGHGSQPRLWTPLQPPMAGQLG